MLALAIADTKHLPLFFNTSKVWLWYMIDPTISGPVSLWISVTACMWHKLLILEFIRNSRLKKFQTKFGYNSVPSVLKGGDTFSSVAIQNCVNIYSSLFHAMPPKNVHMHTRVCSRFISSSQINIRPPFSINIHFTKSEIIDILRYHFFKLWSSRPS